MAKNKDSASYGIIGLGRFGTALAKSLAAAGKDVMIIDSSEAKVRELRQYTEHAFVAHDLGRETLEEAGIQNCDTVVVCIGEKIDTSILTTLNVVSLGVPNVIAKAISEDQGAVLEKIGAEVIYPERDMALRLAKRLLSSSVLDYISLNSNIEISEIRITQKLVGRSVQEADLRRKFGLNIIAIERGEQTMTDINPAHVFAVDDIIVVVGKNESIQRFEGIWFDENSIRKQRRVCLSHPALFGVSLISQPARVAITVSPPASTAAGIDNAVPRRKRRLPRGKYRIALCRCVGVSPERPKQIDNQSIRH